MEGWFDSNKGGGSLNDYTVEHLSKLSTYAAQLMEAQRLHGFCFVRKRWKEIAMGFGNSLIICAINPFRVAGREQSNDILEQLDEKHHYAFFEVPELGFDSRLFALAKRSIKDCLTHDCRCELESAVWSAMVVSMIEVVFTHNFAFRPTGILREAYSSYLNMIYADEHAGLCVEDLSALKINELYSWFNAWQFMERCGFADTDHEFVDDENAG